ncbi:uncharacterized protein JCM15063_004012 [Sporobolomyces koalae]|uniref:uncharacterized protein n=1 Tax=Sporobolomyces koalae TaxID=500713 RepID=UPI0031827805
MCKILEGRFEQLASEFVKLWFRLEGRLGSRLPTGNFTVLDDGRIQFDLVDPTKLTSTGARSNATQIGKGFKSSLGNMVNKPGFKDAAAHLTLEGVREKKGDLQVKPIPFFVPVPRAADAPRNAPRLTIGLNDEYWTSKSDKPIRRDEHAKLLARRGPDPAFPDSRTSRALDEGRQALELLDERFGVGGPEGESDEAMSDKDVRVYLTSFDLGTVQYVAGVVIGREETIFFKQGSTAQKKRKREDSKVVRADAELRESTKISQLLIGAPLPAGGLNTLFAKSFSLSDPSGQGPTEIGLVESRADWYSLPSALQPGLLDVEDKTVSTRRLQNASFVRSVEDSSAAQLVNQLYPRRQDKQKSLVLVIVGATDKTSKGNVGIGQGKQGVESFLKAVKARQDLDLTLLMVNEAFTSKFCPKPECSANLLHPYRDNASKRSPILRLKYCFVCGEMRHRDYVGAMNTARKGLDVIRKGMQTELESLESTDLLGYQVTALLGRIFQTNAEMKRIGDIVWQKLGALDSIRGKQEYLTQLSKDGVANLLKEARDQKRAETRERGQGAGETADEEVLDPVEEEARMIEEEHRDPREQERQRREAEEDQQVHKRVEQETQDSDEEDDNASL